MRAINRELHYFEANKTLEGWQSLAGTEWQKVSPDEYNEWLGESYDYVRWGINDKPVTKNGKPPRVYI